MPQSYLYLKWSRNVVVLFPFSTHDFNLPTLQICRLPHPKMASPHQSAEDLAKQTKIKYGSYCSAAPTQQLLSMSNSDPIRRSTPFRVSQAQRLHHARATMGARGSRRRTACRLLGGGLHRVYNVERYCELTQLLVLDSKGYGIALPKDLRTLRR